MNNIIGIIISFLFVILLIVISSLLGKKKILSNEGTRKFIHIGVSNWWIIAMYYFDNKFYASVVPFVFIITNYLSYRFNIVKAMERVGERNSMGTVYFPISLFILVLISFGPSSHPYIGALGILIMGYGDGFAAIAGKKYGSSKYYILGSEKSLQGTLTMFAVSAIVAFAVLSIYSPEGAFRNSALLALVATVLESITPYGMDNLTVPILTTLFYQLVLF